MSRKLRFFWKTGLFSFKALGFCALIAAILLTAFVWRVSSEPLDISFAKEYIQAALYDEETGRHATMDDAMLYWPDLQGPLYLVLRGGKILNKANEAILSVDEIALSFSRSALLAGKIRPKSVVLKRPALRVTRTPDNRIDIGFDSAEKDAANEQTDITTRILSYIAHPGSEDAKNSIISKLEAFEVEDAQLVVTDQQLEISWFLPHFNAGFFSTDTGMEAKFKVGLPDVNSNPSAIDIGVHYLWDNRNIDLTLDMKNFDLMVLSGRIPELAIFKSMDKIINGHLELSLTQNLLPKFLMANISLNDINLAAEGIFSATETAGTGNITLKIDELAQEKIDSIWPNELRGDNSEKWIVQRMSQGTFKNASAVIGLTVSKDTKEGFGVDIGNIFADFSFENMSVDYRNPLPPVSKMKGTGHFDLETDTMDISVTEGLLGDITVKKATLFFDELVAEGKGHVDIKMDLDGAVQSIFRYISTEPINMGKRLDMDIEKVKGKANINLGLKLPTLPDVKLKDFIITADGAMTDVLLPDLVGDLDVSEGPMNLTIKDGEIHIKGKASLEKRPMDFEWMEYIESEGKPHKSKIKASLTADEDLRKRLGITLEDFLKGDLSINLNYTSFTDNTSVAEMDADASQAVFFVDAFDYEKPSGEAASAKLTAHLKNKELQKITDFTAKGKNFSLAKTSLDFWKLKGETSLHKGALSAFTLGETKGKLDFAFDKKGTVKMMMDAAFLDVQPFMDAEEVKGEYKEPPMLVSVTAKAMRTAPNETVRLAKMYLDIDGEGRFNQMEMDAVAGASAIYLRYKPDEEGKRVFRLKTDDAGAALKAFQVYNNIRGGKMVIYGEPVRGVYDRNLIGLAEITDFKVVDAPSLTKLLSIMSLGGIAELLSGEGLGFSKLEAEFNWLYRKNGSLLVLKNGRTSGNSIGLTFDGTFDNAVRKVDVNGTIVPMSSINNIIGDIPLVGDILTGGSGGIFAATYSVKGSSENPEIGVNPLAVLTPGILRRILFE